MSRTSFILIGITYYIVSVVLIILVLNFINKKERQKYKKEIENLEREKNLIISASILSELNRVEPLINNSDSKELFVEWQRRFKEIKDDDVPKITDALIDIEDLYAEQKYKELRKKITHTELDIAYAKTKAEFLLEEIKSITLSEERNRETITKLKASYREILTKYHENKDDYNLIASPMELQFENVDKLFGAFETAMDKKAYQEIGKIVKAIDITIGNLKIVIEEAPSIILMGQKLIPNKITEILKTKEKMEKEGYNLSFLNLDYNINETNKKIADIFRRLNVLNLEDSIFELKTILDFFESTDNDFDKERLAKKTFEEYSRNILVKVTKYEKINNDLYRKIDDIKYSYDLTNEDVAVIGEIKTALKEIKEKYEEIINLYRSKTSYFTKLAKEMEKINVKLTKTEEKLELTLRTIGSLKDDELRAREQLDEIKDLLMQAKALVRDFKLPVIPDNYYVELSEASEAISEIVKELDRTPISIKTLNTRVDTARDLVFKVYNTAKEYVKTAKMAEMTIVYGNRYRNNKEVNNGLTKAEIMFYKGNFKKSLENAINSLNIVEPGIYKKLIEEYK